MISTEGRVFSKKRWTFLKQIKAKRGFIQVCMDGKNVTLHREMVESFLQMKISRIWFKNGDKTDVRLENLNWTLMNARPTVITRPTLYRYENGQFVEAPVVLSFNKNSLKEEKVCFLQSQSEM